MLLRHKLFSISFLNLSMPCIHLIYLAYTFLVRHNSLISLYPSLPLSLYSRFSTLFSIFGQIVHLENIYPLQLLSAFLFYSDNLGDVTLRDIKHIFQNMILTTTREP